MQYVPGVQTGCLHCRQHLLSCFRASLSSAIWDCRSRAVWNGATPAEGHGVQCCPRCPAVRHGGHGRMAGSMSSLHAAACMSEGALGAVLPGT